MQCYYSAGYEVLRFCEIVCNGTALPGAAKKRSPGHQWLLLGSSWGKSGWDMRKILPVSERIPWQWCLSSCRYLAGNSSAFCSWVMTWNRWKIWVCIEQIFAKSTCLEKVSHWLHVWLLLQPGWHTCNCIFSLSINKTPLKITNGVGIGVADTTLKKIIE